MSSEADVWPPHPAGRPGRRETRAAALHNRRSTMVNPTPSDTPDGTPGQPVCVDVPGQIVFVLQGGGALGAYQAGVYEALHEAKVEPDWVIGTSIGAINGAIIAGNPPGQRIERLKQFWEQVAYQGSATAGLVPVLDEWLRNVSIMTRGIPAFFTPRLATLLGMHSDGGAV
jgi:NTE family protein